MPAKELFVGLIPDGNRRWAAEKYNVPKKKLTPDQLYETYSRGAEIVKDVADRARDEMVNVLAVFGGSVGNLAKREFKEVQVLHSIYERWLEDLKDDWMDKEGNEHVRFVHMGRTTMLQERAPRIFELISEIAEHTQNRTRMIMAFCLDYAGLDESERAHKLWMDEGCPGGVNGWQQRLDLPMQGVPYRPFDLVIRTGAQSNRIVYDNEFLDAYRDETRLIPRTDLFPDYTADKFSEDLDLFRGTEQGRGA